MKSGRVFCNRSNFRFTLALEEGMLIFHIISNFDVFGHECPVLFVACDNPRQWRKLGGGGWGNESAR